MKRIDSYLNFINEEFFKRIGNRKKTKQTKSHIETCVEELVKFLNDNEIFTWDDFIYSNKTDKYIIDKLIDGYAKNMKDLQDIRFKLKLELCNRIQLKDLIKELEENEEYEKCAEVLKKMSLK
jgi:hypothetical protein